MERRTFLLGLIGSRRRPDSARTVATPSQALSLAPQTPSEAVEVSEGAEVSANNLDEVRPSMHDIIAVAADAFTAAMSGAPTDVIRGGRDEGIGGADVGVSIIEPAPNHRAAGRRLRSGIGELTLTEFLTPYGS